MSLRFVRTIERNIKSKISEIKLGKTTPKESGIGKQFNKLKDLDEASFEKLLVEYKKVVSYV